MLKSLIKLLSLLPFFLIPFLGGNHLSLFYITIDKFWIETTFVLLLLIAILVQFFGKGIDSVKKNTAINTFLLFFLPFFAINAISLIYTWNTYSTLNELNTLVWILGTVYLFSITKKKEALIKAMIIGAALSAVCAIVQSKILFPNLIDIFKGGRNAEIARAQTIPFSSFIYHNVFGGFMCFVLPLSLYFGVVRKKWLYVAASAVIITGVILSTSRIAMGLSLIVLAAFVMLMIKHGDKKGVLFVFIIAAAGIAITFVLLQTGKQGDFRGLTSELGKKVHVTKAEVATLNTRTEIWKNGLKAFISKPVIGYGAGAFEYGYRKNFDGGIYTRHAHATLLKYSVELGLIGLSCFVLYLAGFVIILFKRIKEQEVRLVAVPIGCGFVFSLLDFSFDTPAHIIKFFVLSSFVFLNNNFTILKSDKNFIAEVGVNTNDVYADKKKDIMAEGVSMRLKRNLFPSLIIILMTCSFLFTAKAGLARKSIENAIAMEESGFISNAYQSYREAISEMPFDNDGYMKAAFSLKRLYQIEPDPKKKEVIKNALIACLKIIETKKDKDSQLYFVSGVSYKALGELKDAEAYLLKAICYYPSSAYYINEIVHFYISAGDFKKALDWSHAINPFLAKYSSSKNPNGFYVYKIRDMEAELEFKIGNKSRAIAIAQENLIDAAEGRYTISHVKTGVNVSIETFLSYLKGRVDHFRNSLR